MNLKEISHSLGFFELYLWHLIGFCVVYFGLGSLSQFLILNVFPKRKWGRVIDPSPRKAKQIQKEIGLSLTTIFIMSFSGTLALYLEKLEYLHIHWETPSAFQLTRDVFLFFLWNELYFYWAHRLLHTPWLYKVAHRSHHYSKVTSPFASLSFHPIEALFYSGIMISAMTWWDFNVYAMIFWPLISNTLNNIGHWNYTLFPKAKSISPFSLSWHHSMHHTFVNGNYSFWLPQVDMLFGTHFKVLNKNSTIEDIKRYNETS